MFADFKLTIMMPRTENNNPFFVVGCDPSGTTLLTLNGHPRSCIPEESWFIRLNPRSSAVAAYFVSLLGARSYSAAVNVYRELRLAF